VDAEEEAELEVLPELVQAKNKRGSEKMRSVGFIFLFFPVKK